MPRPSKIWLRQQTGFYCTTFKGETVKLSKDRKEAERLFHELMLRKEEEPARQFGPSFRKLADEFLVNTQSEKNGETFAIQEKILKAFTGRYKGRAAELKGHHVTSWLAWENEWRAKAKRKPWGVSTKALAIRTIKAVLNWGVKQNRIEVNPIKGLPLGKAPRKDRVITEAEMEKIKAVVTPGFYDFLFVCWKTGARPYSEVARLEAKDVDFAAGTATLLRHKTVRKTGRPRVLYFTPEVLSLLKTLAERHPTGPLFRTRRGTAWNASSGWKQFEVVEKKAGVEGFTYALRHTRITEALIKGVPVEVVAELVGNTPEVLHKHYSHVGKDTSAMKAAAAKAAG